MGKRSRQRHRQQQQARSQQRVFSGSRQERGAANTAAETHQLLTAVHNLYHRGWQPADLVRVTSNEIDAPAARLIGEAILAEATRSAAPDVDVPPRWADQLAAIAQDCGGDHRGADEPWQIASDDRERALLIRRLLAALPRMPFLIDEPCAWPRGEHRVPRAARSGPVDTKMLERVRALLAKAESTTFEEEANALTAKAQELMTKHAIDQALLAAHAAGGQQADIGAGVEGRRLPVDNPYAKEKSLLLAIIADTNGCSAVWDKRLGCTTVMGFATELDFVELLYTSLLVQATNAMVAAGSQTNAYGQSTTRSFRQSFLVAYASRIGERLAEAVATTVETAAGEHGDLLPVLASRLDAVTDAAEEMFPDTKSMTVHARNGAGYRAGTIAADQADLAVADMLSGQAG